MQRVLQAGARAGCAAHSRSAERSAVQSIGAGTASSEAASLGAALSLPAGNPDEHASAHLGQHSHSTAANTAIAPSQTSLGDLGSSGRPPGVPRHTPAITWSCCLDTRTGSLASARQHILSPLGASFGRPASFASAAQAACQPQLQPFAVRQASNERPALLRRQRAASAEERAAIVARLTSRYWPAQHYWHGCRCIATKKEQHAPGVRASWMRALPKSRPLVLSVLSWGH